MRKRWRVSKTFGFDADDRTCICGSPITASCIQLDKAENNLVKAAAVCAGQLEVM